MNQVIETILSRRTIRNFKSEQISEADLKQILEAGLYAPTAGGRQAPVILRPETGSMEFMIAHQWQLPCRLRHGH